MRIAPKSTRRRAIAMVVLLLLLPVAIAMALRAQGQIQDFEAARALYVEAEKSVHARDWTKAISQLEEVVRICPDIVSAWDALAWCYYGVDQKEKAYETMQQAIQLHPESGRLRRELGSMYLREDKFELAMQSFEQATAADPKDPLAPRLRQRAQDKLDDHKRSSAP